MKKMRLVLTVVVPTLLLLVFGRANGDDVSEPTNLRLWLEMTKSDYKLCENVWIYLFVVNNGPMAVQLPIVDVEDRPNLTLEIVHGSGKILRYGGASEGYDKGAVTVEPGDTVMFPINLSDGFSKGGGWTTKYPESIPLGECTISAKYLKRYETDKIVFRVLSLDKREEAVVLDFFGVLKSGTHGEQRFNKYIDLFERNENTLIGADLGSFILVKLAGRKEKEAQRIDLAKKLIDLYPDNGCAYLAFRILVLRLPDQELKSLLEQRKAILQRKYTRFMFRLAANRYNKSYLIKEVEK
jgi:hypothetical protein